MLRRLVPAFVVACLGASACAAVQSPDAGSSQRQHPRSHDHRTHAPAPLHGVDAADELSRFRCAEGRHGRWSASGVITNPTRQPASYTVTVLVSAADGGAASAKQRRLPPVPPDKPTPFTLSDIPAASTPDLDCQVRIVRMR